MNKIVVIGPESTGKSTLSEMLAGELNTVWVPEYARTYLQQINRPYTEHDLLMIARGQLSAEAEMRAKANKILICDTDLNVIKVWSEHKYSRCDKWVLEQIAMQQCDHYLLTDIDIEWQYDAQREHPEKEMRQYFYRVYKDLVIQSGVPWTAISGSKETRVARARAGIGYLVDA